MLTNILVTLVAFLHLYFLILEMFLWTKPYGLKNFKLTQELADSTAVLAANQGLYNGFLAAGLMWSLFQPNAIFAFQLKVFFLACVLVAGIYGGFTANKKIFVIQALPAALAMMSVMFFR